MKDEQIILVYDFWKMHADEDISTERLLEMCRSYANLEDIGDVVECIKLDESLDSECQIYL